MIPSLRVLILTLAAAAVVVPVSQAQESDRAAEGKIDRALRRSLNQGGSRRVIVTVKPGYRAAIRQSLRAHGDVVTSEAPLVNTLAAEIHTEDVAELARHPWVEYVSEDALVYAGARRQPRKEYQRKRRGDKGQREDDDIDDDAEAESAAAKIRKSKAAPRAGLREILGLARIPEGAAGYDGRGIGVALIDSGIAPNADFTPRISGFYDFTRGGIAVPAYDDYGHGTHIAGLIGSRGVLSDFALMGVAPSVHFIGVKVLDNRGRGRTSTVIEALEFVTANRARLGIRIVNLSLGHPVYAPAKFDPLVRAVEVATDAGLIVVTSAGNHGQNAGREEPGYTGVTSPGNAPSAITVGSAVTGNTVQRADDNVAAYSSRGPTWFDALLKPDVIAPGHQLVSDAALTSELYGALRNNQRRYGKEKFLELSGTSMAAGVTTGLVALMLDANQRRNPFGPALPPNAVKALLQFSATRLPGVDVLAQGAGAINGAGAVELAAGVDTSAAPGQPWAPIGSACTAFQGDEGCLPWSRNVIWSGDLLTGTLVYYNLSAWSVATQWDADNIVWGTLAQVVDDNIVWGTTAVWAANLVWSDRLLGLMDGDNIVWGTAGEDNIVWGTLDQDNIVWGTYDGDNIVWGTFDGDNIVWGTSNELGDNIVWGTLDYDNIVWGTSDDNIVWGTQDNIVWGTSVLTGAGR